MAIYSFKMENISRGEGKSSVASAAYRHRKVFFDNRTGEICGRKTAHKKDLYFAQIFAPDNTPPDLIVDSETLWNAVEASEKRKDARLAKEFKIALPAELTPEQSIELTAAFVLEHFTKKGIIVDVVIHDISGHNPHIHIMGTTREVHSTGFGKKVREWDKPETLDGWRKGWQDFCNELLEKYEHEARVDHRSIRVQHKEALEQAAVAVSNGDKAIWLAKAEETNRDPMRHIPRSRWNTQAAQQQRAAEQAVRDDRKKEAKKTYSLFKALPLEIVVDVRSFTVSVLPEPEEIVLADVFASTADKRKTIPAPTIPVSQRKPATKSYRNPDKVSQVNRDPKPSLVIPTSPRTKLKAPTSPATGVIKRAPVKSKRKQVKPRQSGVFKRFTVYIIDFFKEKFVWAKKKSVAVSADAEHDKRIAENYVFDEVLGIYVPRTEHEKRVRFNSDTYSPTPAEIRRFPSRTKEEQRKAGNDLGYASSSQSVSERNRNHSSFKASVFNKSR
ncbi:MULTISPECIES: MobQ family relaxase [Klebsiella]|uniref:MobQ family relaxase n=1 Tax=Klebsiella TaxID=570 RepID=UPI000E2B9652|nr:MULTISPECIES: MobQ family relaxase [Klebsiella]HBZ7661756.1 MobA/MobL family protein [Klebsiella variicola subsp. variicola]MDK3149243.1 MobQ family relaxase [Klebsiella michiganensis]MDK7030305.1 MobQ family relaxase [Klebsiella grimontii]MDV1376072.1 MobQ family relaxase [Klebsiella michiganensis]MDV1434570.1 MobQ family relaxase [Klebsiella michiganensis]